MWINMIERLKYDLFIIKFSDFSFFYAFSVSLYKHREFMRRGDSLGGI